MSRYVKAIPETERLTSTLVDINEKLKSHTKETKRNTESLDKLSALSSSTIENKVKTLENEIKQIREDSKWVDNSDPAIKLDSKSILRRLDVL